MPIIVFSGKGGTGKTTLSALTIRCLVERGEVTLALDLDPDAHLHKLLGVKIKKTLGEIVDRIHKEKKAELEPKKPLDISDQEYFLSLITQDVLVEEDEFDLITLGKPSLNIDCYCPAFLWAEYAIPQIMKSYEVTYKNVVIDCDPGTEIFPRKIFDKISFYSDIDHIITVLDGSRMSVDTANDIYGEVKKRKLKIKNFSAICNRVEDSRTQEQINEIAKNYGIKLLGFIPTDRELNLINLANHDIFRVPSSSKSYQNMKMLIKKILQ